MNQVYHIFNAYLDVMVPACSVLPESLEVGWFSEKDFSTVDLWGPAANFNTDLLFDGVRRGRFDFVQQTDDFARVISERRQLTYIWQRH